jgi:predicted Zn-dependent protease
MAMNPWNMTVVAATFFVLVAIPEVVQSDIIVPKDVSESKLAAVPEALMSEVDPNVAEKLKPAISMYANNDYFGFKQEYSKVADSTDTLPAVEIFWAKLLITGDRYTDSLRVLEEYVRDHQEDPEAYVTLGILAARTGRFTDGWLNLLYAQRFLDKETLPKARLALVMPNFIDARSVIAESRKQWSEADQMFQKLQTLKPNDHMVTWRAGRCKVLSGNVMDGYQMMSQAYKSNSKLPRAALAIAQILSDTTDWGNKPELAKEVEKWFGACIKEEPNDEKGHAAFFKWLLLNNRPEVVKDRFESLPKELKSIRDIVLLRSVAARYLGDNTLAETLLSAANKEKPDDLEIADQLALVLVESDDESKRGRALQLSERNFRVAPNVETVAATAGWVQMQLGSKDVADKILTQLAARGPLSPQTTYYISELLRSSGREEDATRLLQAAVKAVGLFPQRAKAIEALAKSK